MDWNCTLSEERLSDYLDGLLSQDEAAAFSAHTAGCNDCTQLVARVKSLVGNLHTLEMVEAPPKLVAKILDSTMGVRGWRKWIAGLQVVWQPRFALGALSVAATLLIVLHSSGLTPAKLRKADLNPASLLRSTNRQAHLVYAHSVKYVNDLRVVYEIQSRLQPEPEPTAAPPAPTPPTPAPSTAPEQKSEKNPPRDRSQVHPANMFAILLTGNLSNSLLDGATGSAR